MTAAPARFLAGLLALVPSLLAQAQPARLTPILEAPLVSPDVVAHQLRQHLWKKIPKLTPPSTEAQWSAESREMRRRILDEVVFHGWPREWVSAPPKFEDLGLIPGGKGYRIRKLRYEIVPGFRSTALLYEPDPLPAKAPAILNVNGHVGAPGKAVEYKQKRCINQARQGILSLNLEWLSYGELDQAENRHWFGAHLDLIGVNAVGLFHLAMRKGLDYLYDHPHADRARLGVTGLSGGGWQTIVLSSLDERVAVAVPVAGYSSLAARLERPGDIGDIEQNPTDLLVGRDYPHLTALRAPRPTLLVYNAEDDCCFRAPLVKNDIYDKVRPFFRLYGAEDRFGWHENVDPADHNYQLDNRAQSYRFFSRHFGMSTVETEIPVEGDFKSVDELRVGLPPDNLTILGLARRMAGRSEASAGSREALRRTLRYQSAVLLHPWAGASTKSREVETRSYRFDFEDGLAAVGVWAKAIAAPDGAPATILLHDEGKKPLAAAVAERVNRGEQVLAADLLFTGDAAPKSPGPHAFAQLMATTGSRPLGVRAAQLIAMARWLGGMSSGRKVRVEAHGMRSQVAALAAAALEPALFSEVVTRNGIDSLRGLLDKPVEYQTAPELFCLGLYPAFDIPRLRALSER